MLEYLNLQRFREEISQPPDDHHSFAEHNRIIEAASYRDLDQAAQAMRRHPLTIQGNLLRLRQAAE